MAIAFTPAESAALRKLFIEDAETITRVLAGCQFEWRPTRFHQLKDALKAGKKAIIKGLKTFGAKDKPTSSPEVMSGWAKGTTPTGTRPDNGIVMGATRGATSVAPVRTPSPAAWKAATPSRAGGTTTMGLHRIAPSVLKHVENLMISLSNAPLTEGYNLLKEGVSVGVDLALGTLGMVMPEFANLSVMLAEAVGLATAPLLMEVLNVLPYLGAALSLLKSIASGLWESFQASVSQMKINLTKSYAELVSGGNARSALDGLINLLQRQRNDHIMNAGVAVADISVQSTSLALDIAATGYTGGIISMVAGAALALAKAALALVHAIVRALQDFLEITAANKALKFSSHIDMGRMASKSPLLCCYLITEASPSSLIAMLSSGNLNANWMDDVEKLLPKIRMLKSIANDFEQKSSYILNAKGRKFRDTTGGALVSHSNLGVGVTELPRQVMADLPDTLRRNANAAATTVLNAVNRLKSILPSRGGKGMSGRS